MSKEALRVFLCGEGPCELGSRFGHPTYQHDKEPGVLHCMLEHVQPEGWTIHAARDWKGVRKFQVGRSEHRDMHNVRAAALDAREHGCDMLVFSRDKDSDEERESAVERGIQKALSEVSNLAIVGGVAKPALEGWVLAMLGEHRTEELSTTRATQRLTEQHGIDRKDSRAMANMVERTGLNQIPCDAGSLLRWVERARAALGQQ